MDVAKFLGGGLRGNILVSYDIGSGARKFDYLGTKNPKHGLLNKRVTCNLYLKNVLVRSVRSEIIRVTDSGLGDIYLFTSYIHTYIHTYIPAYIHTQIHTCRIHLKYCRTC